MLFNFKLIRDYNAGVVLGSIVTKRMKNPPKAYAHFMQSLTLFSFLYLNMYLKSIVMCENILIVFVDVQDFIHKTPKTKCVYEFCM